ncbi:ABC-type polysaccharide transport system permease subunit [Paenibacillus endophyticus]|uniref:ABC-type polysaccharide transport system permease subunit n=1 Tax=Paenibacillus endophyticus TaxID=1294268 RepID=A0A7W5GBJ5_9BACL|nr:hypothetical protein [Paenibacillus endophyticus]MBB3153012.1 ABC-type polysaccharide transport system permease subunit [Paenibacillus endophyticus]
MEQASTNIQKNETKPQSNKASIPQLIWKYKLHYVIVLPAMLLIAIFKIIPFVYGVILSMVDYKVFQGLFESDWVGLNHYFDLFGNPDFRSVVLNTIVIKTSYIWLSGAASFILALALSSLKSKQLRGIFATMFLIPYFIPSVVFAYIVIYMLSPTSSPFFTLEAFVAADTEWIRVIIIVAESVKTCGIPIVIALAAIASKHASSSHLPKVHSNSYVQLNVLPALRAVSAFMLLQLSTIFTLDHEFITNIVSPLTRSTGATLDIYNQQMGIMSMEASHTTAAWFIQFIIQLVFTLAAYRVVKGRFLNELFQTTMNRTEIAANSSQRNVVGIVLAGFYSVLVVLVLYMLVIYPFTGSGNPDQSLKGIVTLWNVIVYLAVDIAAVIVFLLMTVTLAFPLTVKRLPGRSVYKLFLLIVMVMASGMVNELLYIRNLGMLGTIFPQLFLGFFNLAAVFVLKSMFNARHSELKDLAESNGKGELHAFFTLFIPKVWKPLLALGVLQFVALWNGYYPSYLYITEPEKQSPIAQFQQLTFSGGEVSAMQVMQLGAWLSLPSILLFFLFRRWLTSEVLTSQMRKL